MRKLSFSLAFAFGWLVAYGLLVLGGVYPSPLWGGEGAQSGLFVLAFAVPGIISMLFFAQSSQLVAFPIGGAIDIALLIPMVSLDASILDVIGSKDYLSWILLSVAMQVVLSLCSVFVVQAVVLRVARAIALAQQS